MNVEFRRMVKAIRRNRRMGAIGLSEMRSQLIDAFFRAFKRYPRRIIDNGW
jgi:hypothetical protein